MEEPPEARTKRGRKSLIDWANVWKRYRDTPNLQLPELGKQLGVSDDTLRWGLRRHYGAAYHVVAKIRQRYRPPNAIDWPKALADYKAGATHKEIANQYGYSEFAIRSGLSTRYGEEYREIAWHRHGRTPADVDWDAVWTEVQAGVRPSQLGAKYGLSPVTIRHNLAVRYGQAYHDRVRGNRGRNNLLSALDWDAIWAEVQAGATSPALGPKYGVSEVTIRHGLARRYGQAYHDRVRDNHGGSPPVGPMPRGTVIGKLYASGASNETIGNLLGVGKPSVYKILLRYPEFQDELARRRERAALIRELHDQGWTPQEIGAVVDRDGRVIAQWLEVRGLIPNTQRRVVKAKAVKPPKLRDRR